MFKIVNHTFQHIANFAFFTYIFLWHVDEQDSVMDIEIIDLHYNILIGVLAHYLPIL